VSRQSLTSTETLPAWISRDLVAETVAVWSPIYGQRLTEREAIEILLDVSRLFDVLGDSDGEAIPGAGESIQP
jgi:predicted hotdog family 3-hydroxylacyl-ACP dehydratase